MRRGVANKLARSASVKRLSPDHLRLLNTAAGVREQLRLLLPQLDGEAHAVVLGAVLSLSAGLKNRTSRPRQIKERRAA
jgi:hypothetical protein